MSKSPKTAKPKVASTKAKPKTTKAEAKKPVKVVEVEEVLKRKQNSGDPDIAEIIKQEAKFEKHIKSVVSDGGIEGSPPGADDIQVNAEQWVDSENIHMACYIVSEGKKEWWEYLMRQGWSLTDKVGFDIDGSHYKVPLSWMVQTEEQVKFIAINAITLPSIFRINFYDFASDEVRNMEGFNQIQGDWFSMPKFIEVMPSTFWGLHPISRMRVLLKVMKEERRF